MTAASLGVIGGYVDYLRVGGIVTLRPFCLISPTDTLASRLAGVYHCCAMLVSQSPQNGVVEVVLMERSSKPVREGSAKGKAIISSSSSSKTLQYNATTLSTALPVRAVRVNASDIVPSPDVPVVPEFTTIAVFTDLLNILQSVCIPWLKENTRESVSGGDNLTLKDDDADEKGTLTAESKEEEADSRLEFKAQEEQEEEEEDDEDMDVDDEDENFTVDNIEEDDDIFHGRQPDKIMDSAALMRPRRGKNQAPSPTLTSPCDAKKGNTVDTPPTVEQEVKALQVFVSLSAFRAFATTLQCETLVYALIPEGPIVAGSEVSAATRSTTDICSSTDTPSPNNSRPNSPVPDSHVDKEEEISNKSRQKILEDVISLAVKETTCGGVCVIEAVEERWTALWSAYEAISRRQRDPKVSVQRGPLDSPPSTKGTYATADILRSRPADTAAESDTFGRHVNRSITASNPLLDAVASIGLFSQFGSQLASRSSATVDPATQAAAIAQMTDMGLPRDWCEVALRRCRYNVELAINMCFENGGDMPQIVAEDAIMQAAQASRRDTESSSARRHRPPTRDEGGRDDPSTAGSDGRDGSSAAARIQYLMSHARHLDASSSEPGARHLSLATRIASDHHRRVLTQRSTASSSTSAVASAMASQLLDMGFPPHWCARAMHAANNDVDAALSWILSHGEELVADAAAGVGEADVAVSDHPNIPLIVPAFRDTDPPVEQRINPLSTVSGSSEVRDADLTCTALNGGFPSVGCRGFPVFKGKWYFELKVHTAGCVQVGWVDSAYDGGADVGEGVGDDSHSWAFDGWRMYLWHELSAEWGAKWSPGDVVGCAVDLDDRSMSFYLNGLGTEIDMGLAFTNMDFSGGLYPCASFNRGEVIQFNFGSSQFAFSPPEGYLPYAQHVHSAINASKVMLGSFSKSLKPLVSYSTTSKQETVPSPSEPKRPEVDTLSGADDAEVTSGNAVERAFFFEDSMEEAKGEREFYWGRRYFPSEEAPRTSIGERPLRYPQATLPSRIPRDREGLLLQIESVSRDLCILYSRMAVFRILRSFPKLKEKRNVFLEFLLARKAVELFKSPIPSVLVNASLSESIVMSSNDEIESSMSIQCDVESAVKEVQDPVEDMSPMEQILLLIRQSCASTQRTKIYLQTVAMLHSISYLPQNIGSVFAAGGAPMLEQLRHSLSDMLALGAGLSNKVGVFE